jgi:hypothetical protein
MSKRFEFRLQRALEWYRQNLAAEKATLQRIIAEIHELDRTMESLECHRLREQTGFQQGGVFLGRDLTGLTLYLASIRDELLRLKASRIRTQAGMVEQRRKVTASHRRVRLLEELEARRKTDWLREASVEEDAKASELFLAATIRKSAMDSGSQTGGL